MERVNLSKGQYCVCMNVACISVLQVVLIYLFFFFFFFFFFCIIDMESVQSDKKVQNLAYGVGLSILISSHKTNPICLELSYA
jgi:hypothetical protein